MEVTTSTILVLEKWDKLEVCQRDTDVPRLGPLQYYFHHEHSLLKLKIKKLSPKINVKNIKIELILPMQSFVKVHQFVLKILNRKQF